MKKSLNVPVQNSNSLPFTVEDKICVHGQGRIYRAPLCIVLAVIMFSCAGYFIISNKLSLRNVFFFMLAFSLISSFLQCALTFILDFLSYKEECKQRNASLDKNPASCSDRDVYCARGEHATSSFSIFLLYLSVFIFTMMPPIAIHLLTSGGAVHLTLLSHGTLIGYFSAILAILVFIELFMFFALSYIDNRRMNYRMNYCSSPACESNIVVPSTHLHTSHIGRSNPESGFNASAHCNNQNIQGGTFSNDHGVGEPPSYETVFPDGLPPSYESTFNTKPDVPPPPYAHGEHFHEDLQNCVVVSFNNTHEQTPH